MSRFGPAQDDASSVCRDRPATTGKSVARSGGDFSAPVSPVQQGRLCVWCKKVLDREKRRDTKFCSKYCRQASWRFGVCRCAAETTERPMTFAYADPPYPGKAGYYPEKTEVNHVALLETLQNNYPDGWALSTSAAALRDVLALCPPGVQVCAWFKGPRPTRSRRALTSWEPVIVAGGRPGADFARPEEICTTIVV